MTMAFFAPWLWRAHSILTRPRHKVQRYIQSSGMAYSQNTQLESLTLAGSLIRMNILRSRNPRCRA